MTETNTNFSNLDDGWYIHALGTLAFQLIFTFCTFHWLYLFPASVIGGLLAIAFFYGREFSQAEYRWIDKFGNGSRSNAKWYAGFDLRCWNFGSYVDIATPIITATIVSLVLYLVKL